MARTGRPTNVRICTMRFTLWAQNKNPREITPELIAGLFGISLVSARQWRTDWFNAISPMEIEGVPSVLGVQFPADSPR